MLRRALVILLAAVCAAVLGAAAARSLAGPWPVPLPEVPLAPPGAESDGEFDAARGQPPAPPEPAPAADVLAPGRAVDLPSGIDSWAAAAAAIAAAAPDRRAALAAGWAARVQQQGAPVYADGVAMFFYYGAADDVFLSGDMNGWHEHPLARVADTDLWVAAVPLPADAVMGYRLVVDGRTRVDPFNPRDTKALGTRYSLFLGPAAAAAADIPSDPAPGEQRRFSVSSRRLGRDVSITAHLPPGCTRTQPCAAVYVLDGPFYLGEGRLARALALEAEAGRLPPLALVAVDPGEDPLRRLEELLPGLVRSADTLAFLADELIPRAEADLPLRQGPEHRALLGMSAGAAAAVQAALDHPGLFDRVAAQSPAPLPFLHQRVQRAAAAGPPPGGWPAVYISWGRFEENIFGLNITAEAAALARELAAAGVPLLEQEWPAGHNMAAWRRTVGGALAALWKQGPGAAQTAGRDQ